MGPHDIREAGNGLRPNSRGQALGPFVVPKGFWHSPRPRGMVTLLYVGKTRGTQVSNDEDPGGSG